MWNFLGPVNDFMQAIVSAFAGFLNLIFGDLVSWFNNLL